MLFGGIDSPQNGKHLEAFLNQQEFYSRHIENVRRRCGKTAIAVLDFGSGRVGSGRVLLGNVTQHAGDRLDLYDPFTKVMRPTSSYEGHVRVVGDEEVYGSHSPSYDIINLSYVLCSIPSTKAAKTLQRLQNKHPHAVFTIVDYVLKGREKAEVLRLLTSEAERKHLAYEGEDAFCKSRTRFDVHSLLRLVRNAGVRVLSEDVEYLDQSHIRAAIAANTPLNNLHTYPHVLRRRVG